MGAARPCAGLTYMQTIPAPWRGAESVLVRRHRAGGGPQPLHGWFLQQQVVFCSDLYLQLHFERSSTKQAKDSPCSLCLTCRSCSAASLNKTDFAGFFSAEGRAVGKGLMHYFSLHPKLLLHCKPKTPQASQ